MFNKNVVVVVYKEIILTTCPHSPTKEKKTWEKVKVSGTSLNEQQTTDIFILYSKYKYMIMNLHIL